MRVVLYLCVVCVCVHVHVYCLCRYDDYLCFDMLAFGVGVLSLWWYGVVHEGVFVC